MKVEFEQNDIDVLNALMWWIKGFNSGYGSHLTNVPNCIALSNLQSRMEAVIREGNKNE